MPRILYFDIETAGPASNKADLAIVVCFGYKWNDEAKAKCLTIGEKALRKFDDSALLKEMSKIFQQADLIVAHYGSVFDRRFLQGRLLIHNLPALPHTIMRDTCMMARRIGNFNSNRLGYLCKILELDHQKLDNNWPSAWFAVLRGDMKALAKMAIYCKGDVLALEALYNRLAPFDYTHPYIHGRSVCAYCGGAVQYRGTMFSLGQRRKRFQCKACHKWGSATGVVK